MLVAKGVVVLPFGGVLGDVLIIGHGLHYFGEKVGLISEDGNEEFKSTSVPTGSVNLQEPEIMTEMISP